MSMRRSALRSRDYGRGELRNDIGKGLPVEGLRISVVMSGVKRGTPGDASPGMLKVEGKEAVGRTLFCGRE
jgi:hypothetical protein